MGWIFRSTDIDPRTGIEEDAYLGVGEDEGKVKFVRRQKLGQVLNYTHESRANAPSNFRHDDGMFHAATIPLVEIERWQTEHGFNWHQATPSERRAWLERHKHFKVRDVRL